MTEELDKRAWDEIQKDIGTETSDATKVVHKLRKPTLKEQKFADAYIANGGNQTEAALIAYDAGNRANAGAIGNQVMDRPTVQALIQSKIKELKDHTADILKDNNLMGLALDTAHSDLQDPEFKVRESARKFILEVAKFLSESERITQHDNRIQNLVIPKWKG